jgi:hypothetical protein
VCCCATRGQGRDLDTEQAMLPAQEHGVNSHIQVTGYTSLLYIEGRVRHAAAQPSVTRARAYNDCSTTLACARPTVTWV